MADMSAFAGMAGLHFMQGMSDPNLTAGLLYDPSTGMMLGAQGLLGMSSMSAMTQPAGAEYRGPVKTVPAEAVMVGALGKVTFNSENYGFVMLDEDPLGIADKGILVIPNVCPLRRVPPIGTRVLVDVVPDRKSERPRASSVQLAPGEAAPDNFGYFVDVASFIDRWGLQNDAQNVLLSLHPEVQQQVMQKFAPKKTGSQNVATCKEELDRPCDGLLIMFARAMEKDGSEKGKGKGKDGKDGFKGKGKGKEGGKGAWDEPASMMATMMKAKGKGKGKEKGKMMASFMQWMFASDDWGGDDAWEGGGYQPY